MIDKKIKKFQKKLLIQKERVMEIYISYFYQIRHFKPYMIPISTAKWDPLWYHDGTRDYDYVFKDKRGVYNGLRADPLHLPSGYSCACGKDCVQNPINCSCSFLTDYSNYLRTLDFSDIIKRCERIGYLVKEKEQFMEEPVIALIVYEAPNNPCSERIALRQWFASNGLFLAEFDPKNYKKEKFDF